MPPKKSRNNQVCQSNKKQENVISKHEDLSALGRRQLPPQGCTRPRRHPRRGDATGSVSDCEVGTREPAQEDAAAMATEGVEDWAESEQKGFFRYVTGSRPCLLPCPRPRPRPCPRVRPCLFFEIPARIPVFRFQFLVFRFFSLLTSKTEKSKQKNKNSKLTKHQKLKTFFTRKKTKN